ncbi:MAG: type IV secretory system conjugative DNA transfer family protein [Pseudomonadota bacterium]
MSNNPFSGWAAESRASAQEYRARESHDVMKAREARLADARRGAASFYRNVIQSPDVPAFLGRGRFASMHELKERKMIGPGAEQGMFLGAVKNNPLFVNGDIHLVTYGAPGTGKGRDVILPNLAHIKNQSLVVIDPKDGENAFASAEHRAQKLGHNVVFINPWGIQNRGSSYFNPLEFIVQTAQMGQPVKDECMAFAKSLVPGSGKEGGDSSWDHGARLFVGPMLEYLARFEPESCRLSELWSRFFCSATQAADYWNRVLESGDAALVSLAARNVDVIIDAPKQYSGYLGAMSILDAFRPGSPGAIATDETSPDFNPYKVKEEPHTIYLMCPEQVIEGAAPWLAIVTQALIETIARAPGTRRCLFMVDEIANLPKMPAVMKAMRLYRGKGISCWLFPQGRNSLRAAGYDEHEVKDIEAMAAVLQMWSISDRSLMSDLEAWGGKMAVPTWSRVSNQSADGSYSVTKNETARSLIQGEDLTLMPERQQLIRANGVPIVLAEKRAWFETPRWKESLRDPRQLFS